MVEALRPAIPFAVLWPEIILMIAGCVILMLGQSRREELRRLGPWLGLFALVTAIAIVMLWPHDAAVGSGLLFDSLARFVRIAALELGILLMLVNWSQARSSEQGEYLSMMFFSLVGVLLVSAADNLLILFLALELTSIPTYIMVVLSRDKLASTEAGIKYFFLGALATAIMAYGFSFLYGVSGTMALSNVVDAGGNVTLTGTIDAIQAALRQPGTLAHGLAIVGITLSLAGVLFKVAAVPLHFYIADVYQGAASPVAGLLGFVPKIAGFVAIFRIVHASGVWSSLVTVGTANSGAAVMFYLLWWIAALSMTVGNLLALYQTNIKRMLAYSGIAHTGYMLVGVLAGPLAGETLQSGRLGLMGNGTANVMYYVVVYGVANLAAFAVLGLLRVRGRACETLRDVAGLLRREPGLALLLALAMFTLMGMPPTPGFWGKLGLFTSAFTASQTAVSVTQSHWLVALVIIGVLNSAVAAAYYLRVVAAALLYDNEQPAHAEPREAHQIGVLLCGFLLLIFAFYPNGLLAAGEGATAELIQPPSRPAMVTPTPPTELPEQEVFGDVE